MEYEPEEYVSMRKVFSIKCFRLLSYLEIYVIFFCNVWFVECLVITGSGSISFSLAPFDSEQDL